MEKKTWRYIEVIEVTFIERANVMHTLTLGSVLTYLTTTVPLLLHNIAFYSSSFHNVQELKISLKPITHISVWNVDRNMVQTVQTFSYD